MKQLRSDCMRLSGDPQIEMARTDSHCQYFQIMDQNSSNIPGRYTYSKTMTESSFYKVILLQCPNYDQNDNTTFGSSICDVSMVHFSHLFYLIIRLYKRQRKQTP